MAVLEWESESQIDGKASRPFAAFLQEAKNFSGMQFFFSSYYFLSKFFQSII